MQVQNLPKSKNLSNYITFALTAYDIYELLNRAQLDEFSSKKLITIQILKHLPTHDRMGKKSYHDTVALNQWHTVVSHD